MKNIFLFLVALALLTSACSEKTSPTVLAKVGEALITTGDFQKKLRQYNPLAPTKPADLKVREKILNGLIETQLLLQEAEARKVFVTEAELASAQTKIAEDYPGQEFQKMLNHQRLTLDQWRSDLKQTLLLKKIFNHITAAPATISTEKVQAYFEKNKEEFTVPEQVRALHILVDSEQEAFEVFAQLRKGVPFETVARERSRGPEAQTGGDLGYFPEGIMPEIFDNAIFPLKVGKISRVVSSDHGYHIFKLLDRQLARERTLAECQKEIHMLLMKQKKAAFYSNWLKQQIKTKKIYKNFELLTSL